LKHIVLVNPPLSQSERYGNLAGMGAVMPSLGLASLAAVCRDHGYPVSIIDAAREKTTPQAIVERILQCRADYVGFTATTCGIFGAAALALELKTKNKEIQTLLGGPHVTAAPRETLGLFPQFDVGFIGEAEHSLIDFAQTMDSRGDLAKVNGIAFRRENDVHVTQRRPFIENLDSLPFPAWDLIPGFPHAYAPAAIRSRHLPAAHLVTSRGCPMQCTFCDRSVFGDRYRLFSSAYTFAMISTLCDKFGVKDILFEDDSFTLHKQRVMQLCEMICGKGVTFSWSCLGRVDTIDTELLGFMKKAGCWQIGFGIESGNSDVLNAADKKINLDRIRETLTLTRAAGIHTKGFFILGLPGETPRTMRETKLFALTEALDDISVSLCTPFPGTALYKQAKIMGEFSPDWKMMTLLYPVFVPKGLLKKQLLRAHKVFLRAFYLRPRILIMYVLRCVTDIKVGMRILRGLLAFLAGAFATKPKLKEDTVREKE